MMYARITVYETTILKNIVFLFDRKRTVFYFFLDIKLCYSIAYEKISFTDAISQSTVIIHNWRVCSYLAYYNLITNFLGIIQCAIILYVYLTSESRP